MMIVFMLLNILTFLKLSLCTDSIYFEDRFLDDSLKQWTKSSFKPEEQGSFQYAAPSEISDNKEDYGIKTSEDAKFYRFSAPLSKELSTKNKDLCVQFSVKHAQDIDCGGGYVKLLGKDFDKDNFNGETPYEIMFGPDICGHETKKVHVIFSYKGKNYLIKKNIPCKSDTQTHLYTLIVKPDNSYEVLIDQESVESGLISDDWDMLLPKRINDPTKSKPTDWVDIPEIDDPNDKKPDDWEKPKTIPDPNAKKPEDWDEEMDGEWTHPTIDNPDYAGEWRPKRIPNPAYKGEWIHPQIDNKDFKDDPTIYERQVSAIGLDLWQVKSGTIFDNFIISTDVKECKNHASYWKKRHDFEQKKQEEESLKTEQEREEKIKNKHPSVPTPEEIENPDFSDDVEGNKMEEEMKKKSKSKENHEEL